MRARCHRPADTARRADVATSPGIARRSLSTERFEQHVRIGHRGDFVGVIRRDGKSPLRRTLYGRDARRRALLRPRHSIRAAIRTEVIPDARDPHPIRSGQRVGGRSHIRGVFFASRKAPAARLANRRGNLQGFARQGTAQHDAGERLIGRRSIEARDARRDAAIARERLPDEAHRIAHFFKARACTGERRSGSDDALAACRRDVAEVIARPCLRWRHRYGRRRAARVQHLDSDRAR